MSTNPATPPAEAPLCELRNVSKEFVQDGERRLRVLEDISLQIHANEIVALLGPSGCGKSTVLRILAGLVPPTTGEVLYRGRPLAGLNPGVALVFQSFALYPWLTVAQNVRIVLNAAGVVGPAAEERVDSVLRIIGLKGFENAYPRALSGGMKQRVGVARALSIDPEILLLDEPFSQVDSLTAESLRAEVVDIWAAKDSNPSSIVLVSHDIKEVAYMADRIVILSANPGRVRAVLPNLLPRPRDYRTPAFIALVDRLYELIMGHELPDVPMPVPSPTIMEPLPSAMAGDVVALLVYLDARGKGEDLFRIATETHRDFGHIIETVQAAELLEFVDTPKRAVVLTPLGNRFLAAGADERAALWRQRLVRLKLFRDVGIALEQEPGRAIEGQFVVETIIMQMPQENFARTFATFVNWARFGRLFAYDEITDMLTPGTFRSNSAFS